MGHYDDLTGKVVLITGSSRGIGFATAQLLHDLGATVILNSSPRSEAELKESSAKLDNCDYFVCDITQDSDVKNMVEEIVKKHGRIDGLVNNAGGGGWASISDPDEEWQKSFDLDIMGDVHACRYVLPQMDKQKSGVVVNISSMWGIRDTAKPAIASYCVGKAGISKLTELLAQQYAPSIRVNAVAPGWTMTRMIEDDLDEATQKFMESNILLRRIAKPEEIANVVLFLLSHASSYITGQIISADGGYILNRNHPQKE